MLVASGAVALNTTSLISNAGILSVDITGVGTARRGIAAAAFSSLLK